MMRRPSSDHCECGCGNPTRLTLQTDTVHGYVKGQPRRFIAGHYRPPPTTTGYPMRTMPDRRRVREHVVVAERALGRLLPAGAEVHHVDEVRTNNANRNLVICQDRAYHVLLHVRMRIVRAGGNPDTDAWCCRCKQPRPSTEFWRRKSGEKAGRLTNVCRRCIAVRDAQRRGVKYCPQCRGAPMTREHGYVEDSIIDRFMHWTRRVTPCAFWSCGVCGHCEP